MPDLLIDQSRRSVYLNGQELQLSPQEYRVLHYLGCNPGVVVQKHDLLAAMWSTVDTEPACLASLNPAAVDLVIFRLRKKLHDTAHSPVYLETRRGFGYILHHAKIIQSEGNGKVANQTTQATRSSEFTPTSLDAFATMQPWSALTRQEWQIFMLLGDEQATRLTNRALAQQLGMTEGTLKKHLQHIYRKLSVENRSGAALLAMRVKASFQASDKV